MARLFLKFFILLSLITQPVFGLYKYSIVFIHIGPTIPPYVSTAISQARLFNEKCAIILVANQEALDKFNGKFSKVGYVPIPCETLLSTQEHQLFLQESSLDTAFRDGFWKYASERFLYLNDLMAQYDLKNVFHMEYDNMLYVNLEEFLPIFEGKYQGIGATFDDDERCIPGFVFIRNQSAMSGLAKYFVKYARAGLNDMEVLGLYRNQSNKERIDRLPIIMPEYIENHSMTNQLGFTPVDKNVFANNYDQFCSIFDAAALGQYLGGIDPRNGPSSPGFINERCVFNPSLLSFEWFLDDRERRVPYAIYGQTLCRINNLHVHSKKLEEFMSFPQQNVYSEKDHLLQEKL